jgi:hypothetical protein
MSLEQHGAYVATKTPLAFASIIRPHDAQRAGIQQLEDLLDVPQIFAAAWSQFQRISQFQTLLERAYIYPMFDSPGESFAVAEGFSNEHTQDDENRDKVNAILNGSPEDNAALKAGFMPWREYHLRHLEHEDNKMLQSLNKLSATPANLTQMLNSRVFRPVERQFSRELAEYIWWTTRQLNMADFATSSAKPQKSFCA